MSIAATRDGHIALEVDEGAASGSSGWSHRLDQVQDAVAGILLVEMVVVATVQVVSRYVFSAPMPWPEELARWSFLWLVMIGVATATRFGAHIRMGLLPDALGARARSWMELTAVSLSAASLSLVGYLGVLLMKETTLTSVNLGISYRWLYLALPLGAVLALVSLSRVSVAGWGRRGVVVAVGCGVAVAVAISELVERSILVIADPTSVALVGSVGFIVLGVPIAHALLLGAYVAFQAGFLPDEAVATQFSSSMSTNFVLLAIPFFVLMGALMNAGGLTSALVRLAQSLVGHWRGGLGQVNVLTSTLLGGVSGSSSADTATVTKTLVPEMERHGYRRDFACAITSTAAITATLIPPSISFLIYASLAGVSVGALFMAGVVPGLIFAASLMAAVWALSRFGTDKVTAGSRASWSERRRAVLGATPALLLPLGILMMLRAGAVTATEAGAVASVLAAVLGFLVYRKLRLATAWEAIMESARDTAVILFLLAASAPLAWLLISEQLPVRLADSLAGVSSPALVMIGIVGVLLVVGVFLEPPPAMVLMVPVLAPLAAAVGIDLVHLGVLLVFTVMVGQLTPPVGGLVFISAALAKESPSRVFWATRWLYVPIVFLLILLVLVPGVSLLLPHLTGF